MSDHDTQNYEQVWPPYGVQIADPDTRTATQRTDDELAALRSDLVMALATIQDLNRRMAGVENRLHQLEYQEAHP